MHLLFSVIHITELKSFMYGLFSVCKFYIWKVRFLWRVVLALENDLGPIQGCNDCFGNSSSKRTTQQGVQCGPSGPQVLF